jgi:hypothetical protein
MSLLTPSHNPAHGGSKAETAIVMGSLALLAGLILADRFAAWLIGEFPTSGFLWQLRFEYLRPIGVYYDVAVMSLGQVSSLEFSGLVLVAAALIAIGMLSRIRLLRALACHLVCGIAAILWACSLEYREGIYAPAGSPSGSYEFVGALLALPAAALCLRIHAEYVGWNPANSTALRRSKIAVRRVRRYIDGRISDLVDQLDAASKPRQIMLAPLRIVARNRFGR